MEILLDATRQVTHPTVAEQGDLAVGDPLEEVAVVGDDEERAGPAVEVRQPVQAPGARMTRLKVTSDRPDGPAGGGYAGGVLPELVSW